MAASASSSDNESQIEQQPEDIFGYAMQLANGSVLPMALNAAIQLGVFDILAKAGDHEPAALSVEQIAARMPTDNPNAPAVLERLCRLLVDQRVLANHSDRLYCLTPVSKHFVRNEDGVSLAPLMTLVNDEVFFNSGSKLKDAVLEGGVPFNKFHGMNFYEYLERDDRFSEVFNTAMFNHTHILVKEILESWIGLAFKNLNRVVDVGGGTGVALRLITSKYPHIQGINFDLPHVIQHALEIPGVRHSAGDMFEWVPEGDGIFLKWILHDWSDDRCLKLLKNCYNALPINGKVIVVDHADYPKGKTDVLMLTLNMGGKERWESQISRLATQAGFENVGLSHPVLNTWVMQFKK